MIHQELELGNLVLSLFNRVKYKTTKFTVALPSRYGIIDFLKPLNTVSCSTDNMDCQIPVGIC